MVGDGRSLGVWGVCLVFFVFILVEVWGVLVECVVVVLEVGLVFVVVVVVGVVVVEVVVGWVVMMVELFSSMLFI